MYIGWQKQNKTKVKKPTNQQTNQKQTKEPTIAVKQMNYN